MAGSLADALSSSSFARFLERLVPSSGEAATTLVMSRTRPLSASAYRKALRRRGAVAGPRARGADVEPPPGDARSGRGRPDARSRARHGSSELRRRHDHPGHREAGTEPSLRARLPLGAEGGRPVPAAHGARGGAPLRAGRSGGRTPACGRPSARGRQGCRRWRRRRARPVGVAGRTLGRRCRERLDRSPGGAGPRPGARGPAADPATDGRALCPSGPPLREADRGAGRAARARARSAGVVSTGFADVDRPNGALAPDKTLAAGRQYLFWFELGEPGRLDRGGADAD